MRKHKYLSGLVLLVFFTLTPVTAITEPVEILSVYHEGALISVQLVDYSIAGRSTDDSLAIFIVISPEENLLDIQAAMLFFDTDGGGNYFCFWILDNPYYSSTWLPGFENQHFTVISNQFDFMLSEYTQLSSVDLEILVFAGIFPGFPVSSSTNDFSPILMEYDDILVEYQAMKPPSTTTTTTPTTTTSALTSTSTTTTAAITPAFGVFLGLISVAPLLFLQAKKRKNN
jgi:hypothetical protein